MVAAGRELLQLHPADLVAPELQHALSEHDNKAQLRPVDCLTVAAQRAMALVFLTAAISNKGVSLSRPVPNTTSKAKICASIRSVLSRVRDEAESQKKTFQRQCFQVEATAEYGSSEIDTALRNVTAAKLKQEEKIRDSIRAEEKSAKDMQKTVDSVLATVRPAVEKAREVKF